jgi:micrococcal nuclease
MYEYKAKVVRVLDGDTIDVSIDLGFDIWVYQRVRLLGINTAEKNTELGKKTIDYVRSLCPLGSSLTLRSEKDKREKFGRYLAKVYFPESKECLNDILIQKGMAVEYWGVGKKEDFVPDPTKLVE